MKGVLPLFFCSALAWAGGEGLFSQSLPVRAEVGSPVAVAGFHEQLVMDGLGVLFPGEEQALIPGGIVTFGGGEDTWPPLFRLGLVARDENGVATCPFTVELDDDTGEVLFRNANGALFYSVAPAYVSAAEWFRLRLGLPAFGPVHLEVSIAGYKGDKPTFDTYVEEMRPVPVVAWIVVGPNDCPATNRPHIESLIQDVNALLHQICISCYLHEVNYTSRWDWFQYDYGAIGNIADIVAVQNSSTGIEVHFVDQLIGASGISTKNGIVLPALASSCTFAHEIGHTMGFPDIYVRKRIHLVSGPVQANREPEDWSGTTNRGFYKEELSQAELICRLVMFGDYSDDSFDFPAGDIDGIRELKDYPYGYTNSMVRIGVCPGTRTWIPQND